MNNAISDENTAEQWVDEYLSRHSALTIAVKNVIESRLRLCGIDYLLVSARTKDKKSAMEKFQRKGYSDPRDQCTDLTGVRIIAYLESGVSIIAQEIEKLFSVDPDRSLNKDSLLSSNQVGYRSIHYVCRIGEARGSLPEFQGLSDLKFEIQIRTVLQHAWAELSHDRSYKFSGQLPPDIERFLNLYAGMLEIADKGIDDLSKKIDRYISEVSQKSMDATDDHLTINSITILKFAIEWCKANGLRLEKVKSKDNFAELVRELKEFGINNIGQLRNMIPPNFAEIAKGINYQTNTYGLIRDWMITSDWRRFYEKVNFHWAMEEAEIFNRLINNDELDEFKELYGWAPCFGGLPDKDVEFEV